MSDELTAKQDAFCIAFIETGNATEAYRRAYDVASDAKVSWLHVEACQLLDHPKITLRLGELRAQAERLAIFNTSKALEEFEAARALAMKAGQVPAAVSAISGKVKLLGLDRPKRLEVTNKDGDAPKSIEELAAQATRLGIDPAALGLVGGDEGSGED